MRLSRYILSETVPSLLMYYRCRVTALVDGGDAMMRHLTELLSDRFRRPQEEGTAFFMEKRFAEAIER